MYIKTKYLYFLTIVLFCASCGTLPKITDPVALNKRAHSLYEKKQYTDAATDWKNLQKMEISPDLATETELNLADAYYYGKKYIEAEAAYKEFRKMHPANEKAPYALFQMGMSNYKQFTGIDRDQTAVKNALIYFQEYVSTYPESEYFKDATGKVEESKTKLLQYEQYIANFYYRRHQYKASAKRMEDALAEYPDNAANDRTLYLLGLARTKLKEKDKANEAFQKLIDKFPNSKYAKKAKSMIKK
ncbi:MAG: outer membrane protein assembly factor BamD [Desulfuromonadales bacterium]|nr:outer membrane protein assembly factor BamD [Desulfuromonadales bacterium]